MIRQDRNEPHANRPAGSGVLGAIAEPGTSVDLSAMLSSPQLQPLIQQVLDRLCELLPAAVAGIVVLKDESGAFKLAASKLSAPEDQASLLQMSERALTARSTVVLRSLRIGNAQARAGLIVASPVTVGAESRGAIVMLVSDSSPASEVQVRRSIDLATGWLQAAFARVDLAHEQNIVIRARVALQALALVDEHESLEAAAMQLTSHLEGSFACDRANIGVVDRKGAIKVIALSHSMTFDARSDEVRRVQGAMEECLDQDSTIVIPAAEGAPRVLALAHRAMGDTRSYLSVVLHAQAMPLGVITLEREVERPFQEDEIAACELLASLVAPALDARKQRQRWLSGRIVRATQDRYQALFGPRRPAFKLGCALAACLALWLMVATGEYRVSAKAVVEGMVQRAAAAPFDGFIAQATARAGQIVRKGDVLAVMDDHDLRLERMRWQGEREQRLKQYNDAFVKHDRATTGVLAAQVDQAESQLALAEENLARAQVTAPLDGIIVTGDLSQLIGSPIEKGKVLFEIAPLEKFRVVLKVDERDVARLQPGQTGQLAITGLVGSRVPFRVQNVTSVTNTDEGRNLFRVEAELLESSPAIRPGMEGVGKVVIGDRKVFWIWTHGFFDWVRLKLWTLLP